MKVQEVLLKAMSGEIKWYQAAEILGCSERTVRRYRLDVQRHGYEELYDRRRRRPSPKRAPAEAVEQVLELYRRKYRGFNVRHFHDVARRDHGVELSYSLVKKLLQDAGLVRKHRARGRHRLRREPRACFGELLHLDGSPHAWLSLVPDERQTMIAVIDDATKRLLYAQLHASESTDAVLSALRAVVGAEGVPMALYTDRARWAFITSKAGERVDEKKLTQVGRALKRLGIEHIPSYSPQARGPWRAAQPHAAGTRRQRTAGRGYPHRRSREPVPAGALYPRLRRALHARATRRGERLRRNPRRRPRPGALPRGGTRSWPGQRRPARGHQAAAPQAARTP